MVAPEVVDLFTEKARAVSAVVTPVKSLKEAFAYTLDICAKKEACQLLVSGCEEALSPKAEDLCETKATKIIAAPGLAKKDYAALGKLCAEQGIVLTDGGLRERLGGIDIGFTVADYAIAETGSLVLDSTSEELRLATMISEIHVAVVPLSKLAATAFDLETELTARMKNGPSYLAFISGASRTADIERVLAIGVHGPLELHILLLEDK
jgi:L-lactate dehydrogenase complex protein LldG